MSSSQPSQSPNYAVIAAASAAALTGLYVAAEVQLLAGVAWILRRVPAGYAGQVQAAQLVRRLSARVVVRLDQDSSRLIDETITAAASHGAADGPPAPPVPPAGGAPSGPAGFDFGQSHADRSAQAIRDDLVSELDDVRKRITRLDDDIYKIVAPQGAVTAVLDNGWTSAQAQAKVWRDFTRQGVTGFTDKSGRDWSLSSYVEMAVRTATARAYNASHLAVMQAAGLHEFTVSDDGAPCPLCQPWQGRIITDLPGGKYPTIDDATAAGLFHPQCRHVLTSVTEHTKLPPEKPWTPEDDARYKATQKQRRLELAIRKAKQEAEYARTTEARQQARKDVRAAQAKLREFVNSDPNLKRHSRREQINLADHKMRLPE